MSTKLAYTSEGSMLLLDNETVAKCCDHETAALLVEVADAMMAARGGSQ